MTRNSGQSWIMMDGPCRADPTIRHGTCRPHLPPASPPASMIRYMSRLGHIRRHDGDASSKPRWRRELDDFASSKRPPPRGGDSVSLMTEEASPSSQRVKLTTVSLFTRCESLNRSFRARAGYFIRARSEHDQSPGRVIQSDWVREARVKFKK